MKHLRQISDIGRQWQCEDDHDLGGRFGKRYGEFGRGFGLN
jgi:hypothetical protein